MSKSITAKDLLPKIIVVIGISVFTLIMFESLARVLQVFNPPLSSYHQDFDLKYQLAKEPPESGKSIVFLGDSLTERAVYTEYLQMLLKEKGQNYDVLNLATPGATPAISLNMLKRRVNKAGKPNLVIMGITFRAFHQYWQTELVNNENPNIKMDESYYGSCVFNKPKQIDKVLLCSAQKVFISVRHAPQLVEFIHDIPAYLLTPKRKMWSIRQGVNTLFFKRGWVPRKDDYMTQAEFKNYVSKKTDEFKNYDRHFANADKRGWYSEKFMAPLVAYCNENNIPLVLVLPPSTKALNTVFYDETLKMPKAKFITSVRQYAHSNNIYFWDLSETFSQNETRLFNDVIHLNVLGSLPYTDILATKIAKENLAR